MFKCPWCLIFHLGLFVPLHLSGLCISTVVTSSYSLQDNKGLLWPWSYGSWIYIYLCTQSGRDVQHHVIKFISHLRHVSGFLWVLMFPPPIKLMPWYSYNWNIVESGVKHHQTNNARCMIYSLLLVLSSLSTGLCY